MNLTISVLTLLGQKVGSFMGWDQKIVRFRLSGFDVGMTVAICLLERDGRPVMTGNRPCWAALTGQVSRSIRMGQGGHGE